jgi:LytS/YehU family sensor histidine kinase
VRSGVALREERGRAEETRLTATLEVELLRKNLEPHFFLNTLTALSEVVERDPRSAVNLIEDLAGEFRVMSRMSGEKQVPLAEELELCRAHLRVMSVRTGTACRLEVENVDAGAPVPPALFLTLIENSFVHQRTRDAVAVFRLRATPVPHGVRYSFFSPRAVKPPRQRAAGGTGMRYVRARLEESFAGRWTLHHGAEGDGGQTVIEIRSRNTGGRSEDEFGGGGLSSAGMTSRLATAGTERLT